MNDTINRPEIAINLKPGMFTTCSLIWDEKQGKYRPATITEVADCCIKNCAKNVEDCDKYSRKHLAKLGPEILHRGLSTCRNVRKVCLDTCKQSSDQVNTNNPYAKCAHKNGCMGVFQDPQCIIKNKDKIFKCCRETCIPTKDLDCQRYCNFMQSVSSNPSKIGKYNIQVPSISTLTKDYKFEKNDNWNYILISCGVVLFLIIIFLLIKVIFQKRR
jgi:hypothetical protein